MPKPVHILGFAGSLRKQSYNRSLLAAAEAYLPEGVTLEQYDISHIPLFNQDVLDSGEFPEPVQRFIDRIAAADALLIATPEYNYSVPGVLKNAIDWPSRAPGRPFNGKPVAVMGASDGPWGTIRAQLHLRQVFVFLNAFPVQQPQLMVPKAGEKFDAEGRLTDEAVGEQIRALLAALAAWTRRLRGETGAG
ncbi:MAG: hypothetical protein QOH93_3083 [Chloroflexia bacterium]|jgi:chromate reductase|nr:hypothetical protein [Chloroflexia bacterium]